MPTQWNQRELVPLKSGDKAFWISGELGKPTVITITGECDEGQGYTAHCPRFAADHELDSEFADGMIHTCNGFLAGDRKTARAESLRIARKLRAEYAAQQADITRTLQYLDWVIARGGKH